MNFLLCIIKNNKGAATLPTVMALVIFVVVISAGLVAVSVAESFITQGFHQSSKAFFYAEAGAKDALMRIARNKNYECDTPSSGCYQIEFASNGCSNNDGCAKITVSDTVSPKIIDSIGQVKGNIRKVRLSITFDSSGDGEIQSVDWEEN